MLVSCRFVATLLVLPACLFGCTGILGGEGGAADSVAAVPGGPTGSSGGAATTGGAGTNPANAPIEATKPFGLPNKFPVLLPFDVRMSRLSAVVGLPLTDPVFELMAANATQLGDYDFADGLEPDNTWTAFKISLWVQSLKPICASSAMRVLYPSLPESLEPMIDAAYGRAMTAQDAADLTASLEGLALTPESRTQTGCLSLLSSLEFLAQ